MKINFKKLGIFYLIPTKNIKEFHIFFIKNLIEFKFLNAFKIKEIKDNSLEIFYQKEVLNFSKEIETCFLFEEHCPYVKKEYILNTIETKKLLWDYHPKEDVDYKKVLDLELPTFSIKCFNSMPEIYGVIYSMIYEYFGCYIIDTPSFPEIIYPNREIEDEFKEIFGDFANLIL